MLIDAQRRRLHEVARARCEGADAAHDFLHVHRVLHLSRVIAEAEGANVEIATTAALLHELFNHPKGHPESHRSAELCAEHAAALLRDIAAPDVFREAVCGAIRTHSFSAGLEPETLEAAVLQDADRLDALGAIGVARCFATCAAMARPFYADEDPFCESREPDDKLWGVDHFYRKLLKLEGKMNTDTGRAMAKSRTEFLRTYLTQLRGEIAG